MSFNSAPQYQLDNLGLAGAPDPAERTNLKDGGTLGMHSENLFDHLGGDTYGNIIDERTGRQFADLTEGTEESELAVVVPRHRGTYDVLPPLKEPEDELSRMAAIFLAEAEENENHHVYSLRG